MKALVQGFFALRVGKTYLILDTDKNEIGKLDVYDKYVKVKIGDNEEEQLSELEIQPYFEKNSYVLSETSPRWIEYNPNPNPKNSSNDCTIRAYCAAENITWDEAYDIACVRGKGMTCMPNEGPAIKDILETEFGYTQHKLSKEEKKMTVAEFGVKHPEGTFVLITPSHAVTVIDGEYYDSWDSGEKKVKCYYSKN